MFFREREAVIQSTLEAQKNAHTDRRAMPTPYELSSATRTSIAEEFAKLFLKAKDDEPFADVNYSDLAEDVAEEIGFVDRKQVHEVLMLAPDFDNNGRLSGVVFSNASGKRSFVVNFDVVPAQKKARVEEFCTGKGGVQKLWVVS
jgi:hypothetical protein